MTNPTDAFPPEVMFNVLSCLSAEENKPLMSVSTVWQQYALAHLQSESKTAFSPVVTALEHAGFPEAAAAVTTKIEELLNSSQSVISLSCADEKIHEAVIAELSSLNPEERQKVRNYLTDDHSRLCERAEMQAELSALAGDDQALFKACKKWAKAGFVAESVEGLQRIGDVALQSKGLYRFVKEACEKREGDWALTVAHLIPNSRVRSNAFRLIAQSACLNCQFDRSRKAAHLIPDARLKEQTLRQIDMSEREMGGRA